jgi:hypothetical protein
VNQSRENPFCCYYNICQYYCDISFWLSITQTYSCFWFRYKNLLLPKLSIAKRMWNRHAFHCQENVESTCLSLPRECGIDMPFIAKRMWNRHAFHCQENVKSTCLSPLKYKTIKWFTFTFTLIYICTFYSLDCIRQNENNNTNIWMGLIQIKVACICTGSTNNILVESYSTLSVKELVPVSIKVHSLLVVYFWISWKAIMNRSWMWWTYVYCYLYWNKM